MLAYYSRIQFARNGAVAVHELPANDIQVIQTSNGRITVDRIYEFATAEARDAYLADLDERLAESGFVKEP